MDIPKSSGGRSDGQVDVLDQLKFLKEETKYNRNRINAIEEKMSTFEQPRRTYSAPDPTTHTEVTDETDITPDYMFLSAKNTIPAVRECTYAEFKNRFNPHGKDGRYAVDALVSGLLLNQEIQEEHGLRDKFEQRGPTPTRNVKDKTLAKAVKMANATANLISQAQSEEKWLRRLRIQSPALLRILAKVNREKWSDRPRTYYRPFNSLIYQHPQMQKALKELEERWAPQLDGDTASDASDEGGETDGDTTSDAGDEGGETDGDEDSVDDSPKALACLRAYVKYIDEEVMPDYHRFEDKDVSSNARVRFSDLWYLFRTGELVYRQVDGELPDRRDFRTGKRIWKTYYVDPVPGRLPAAVTSDTEIKDAAVINDDTAFSLGCYYIDYTGEGFCVVKKKVKIEQFPGEILVSTLPTYPIRFCQDWKGRLDHAIQTGESLIKFMKAKHCSYSGWTLIRSPSGDPTTDANGVQLQQPEHINSEVMVDFGEAFQACPSWRPHQANMQQKIVEGLTIQDDFRIRWWSDADRSSLLGETTELIPVKSGVTSKQHNRYISEDPFLVTVSENAKRLQPTTEKDLTDDAKALLTGRVFAYVFQERKFAQLAVAKLHPSPKTGLALNSLKIPQTIKHAIQGSIQGHFLQKNAERKIDHDWVSLDLIQGKGTGLFILLHGVPGVGKTATAEAIAQANGKPLFKITVGDLGMTPEKLEMSLREIFRLASIWDCILLLDEVDTFFSQRSRADTATTKNALVSVFLRVLDYYDGILFLTTNRAGVLDEAFKSRIHYKIYYPDLTLEQTLDIWKLNIQRVRRIEEELAKVENRDPLQINENELIAFAKHRFEGGSQKRGSGRWNGRQIRNAFQVARSLAYYEHGMREEQLARRKSAGNTNATSPTEARDGSSGPPTLDVRHFETMHDITASFENYRTAVHGGTTDADLALEAEYRNDGFRDNLTEGLQAEYRDHHLRAAAAAGGDGVADEADSNTGNVAGRVQRPRQQYVTEGDDYSAAESLTANRLHRGSLGSRNRSGSYLSVGTASPPNVGFDPAQMYQQPRLPAVSPRHGPMRDTSTGSLDPSGSYPPVGSSRAGYPAQNYSTSPRNSMCHTPGASGYRPPPQYGNEAGGMATTPRGTSPAIGESGMPLVVTGGGRDYAQQDYYGSSGNRFSPTSRDELGMFGATGPHRSGGWSVSAGGQGYENQYGRDPLSRPRQNVETDLSLDEGPF